MKALRCTAFGPVNTLSVQQIPTPALMPEQVLVEVKAAALNFPDALVVQGKYQNKPSLPFSPGFELSGVITDLGPEVNTWNVGDRVMATVDCGAFAEFCAVDGHRLVALPSNVDFREGAATILTYGTALYALKDRAKIQPGETILILGAAGGVGTAATHIAKLLGARVIAAASTDERTALCLNAGADDVINYTTDDLKTRAKQLTDNRGVDVVVDCVGGAQSEAALRALGWHGRFLVLGFAAGEIPRIPLNLALLNEREILGVFWGETVDRDPARHRENMTLLQHWMASKQITPAISQVVSLAEASTAIEQLATRQATGKIVVNLAS